MKARPDTNLALAARRTAYAVLPNGGFDQPCSETVELVSPRRKLLCELDARACPDRSCDTLEVRLGLDGTILQRLPLEWRATVTAPGRPRPAPCASGLLLCTERFPAGAEPE